MYLRFVVADIDADSERELGAFHAARYLRYEGKLHAHEEEQHDLILQWFNEHAGCQICATGCCTDSLGPHRYIRLSGDGSLRAGLEGELKRGKK